jgi:DNA-binding Lrp family transcriptional regulator
VLSELDLTDRRILFELDRNARQSNAEIAKKWRLSREVVNYRIKRLEDKKIISNYYTIINNIKLGYNFFRTYLKFFDCSPLQRQKIFEYLLNEKNISVVGKLDGWADALAMMVVKDVFEFEKTFLKFKQRFKQFIEKEFVSIFTKWWEFGRAFLIDKKINEVIFVSTLPNKVKLDPLDFKILKILSKNARTPLKEISETLKKPPRTIAFRIKRLEKEKIILGYRAHLNIEKLGLQYYKVDLTLKSTEKINELIEFSKIHPNILYIDQTIGGSDFEFDLEVKNRKEFFDLMDLMLEKFPEIRSYKYFSLKSFAQLEYLPFER